MQYVFLRLEVGYILKISLIKCTGETMSPEKRPYTIIADDYGLGFGHNKVMRELLKSGAIDGVSVLVSEELKGAEADKLKEVVKLRDQQIGLHLNLTDTLPGINFSIPIGKLLFKSFFGGLDKNAIRQSVIKQFELFQNAFEQAPDFVDGHQHCHSLPVISEILLGILEEKLVKKSFWVRSACPLALKGMLNSVTAGGFKSLIIMYLGLRYRRILRLNKIRTNNDFSGIMHLDSVGNIKLNLRRTLADAKTGCVVMTHPGDSNDIRQCRSHAPEARDIEAKVLMDEWNSSGSVNLNN